MITHQLRQVASEGIRALSGSRAMCGAADSIRASSIWSRPVPLSSTAALLHRHVTKDARAAGETEQRLYPLPRGTKPRSNGSGAGRARLDGRGDGRQQGLSPTPLPGGPRHFSEKELVDLTLALIAINGWNRLGISFRTVPGTYQPKTHAPAGGESRKGAAV